MTEVLHLRQDSRTNPPTPMVLRGLLVDYIPARERSHFRLAGGSSGTSPPELSSAPSRCSCFRTRIEFTRWEVPAPLIVHSKLSILSATMSATGGLSGLLHSSGISTPFNVCSLITFSANSVSISSIRL